MARSDPTDHGSISSPQPGGPRRDSAFAVPTQFPNMGSLADAISANSISDDTVGRVNSSQGESHFAYTPALVADLQLENPPADFTLHQPFYTATQCHIAEHLKDIYRFFVRIGALEATSVSYGPHQFTYPQLKAFANAGFDIDAVALLTVLPWSTDSINLLWNSQALDWSRVLTYDPATGELDPRYGRGSKRLPECLSQDLQPSEVPLTEFIPGSLGYYWVLNAKTGMLKCTYLGADNSIEEEEPWSEEDTNDTPSQEILPSDTRSWDGKAIDFLSGHLACLQKLDINPVRLWGESEIKPGFVVQCEQPVYEKVKSKLYDYGWPNSFRRAEWVRDLPNLVEGWKIEKLAYLESMEQRTAL